MKLLPLTKGRFAKVDDSDFEYLNQWKWSLDENRWGGYAIRNNGKGGTIRMHRELLNPKKKDLVDHINGDGLDNQRQNLRVATAQQNAWNSRRMKRNTSGFRGVSKHSKSKLWQARIYFGGKTFFLGLFDSPMEAAKRYQEYAKKLRGEFASENN